MIYIHIPFCRTFCTYCGFYSELAGRNTAFMESFAEAVANEYSLRKEWADKGPATVYIGGGTPSVLPLSVLSRIAWRVSDGIGKTRIEEFTVEVNPDDIVREGPGYVEALLASGMDRVSMGVQSLDDGILRWMNRRHTAAQAVGAYRILRSAGVRNVSVDLIFGLSMMDDSVWNDTLDGILALPSGPPEHISAYQLSVESGSALDRLVACGRYTEAGDEQCGRQYEILCRKLGEAGYRHYEVSNFALPGCEAVHNSSYWTGKQYVGLGPGAHSYICEDGRYMRCWNRASVEKYAEVFSSPEKAGKRLGEIREFEILTESQMAMERIMLSLRTDTGLDEKELRRIGNAGNVDRMIAAGDLERLPGGAVRIPESRFFVSDAIISRLV